MDIMYTYPDELPKFKIGMRYNDKENFVRTEMDAGPDRVRKSKTKGAREFYVKTVMTSDELAYFEYWIESYTDDTEDSFYIDIPISGTDKTHTVYMADKPEVSYIGNEMWDVSYKLETEDIQYVMDASTVHYYISIADGSLTDGYFDDMHLLAQTTLFTELDLLGDSSTWP